MHAIMAPFENMSVNYMHCSWFPYVTHHMHCKERLHGAVPFAALPQVNDTISCACFEGEVMDGGGDKEGRGGA